MKAAFLMLNSPNSLLNKPFLVNHAESKPQRRNIEAMYRTPQKGLKQKKSSPTVGFFQMMSAIRAAIQS